MAKLPAFFISIVLAACCPLEAGTDFMNNMATQPSLNQGDSYISKVLDVSSYLLSSLKNIKVLVEHVSLAKPDVRPHSLAESSTIPSSPQAPSKHRAAKMFEMGMHMPLSQKFSWGAEVGVSKYKNNLTSEIPQKRPLAGLRLKPDLYTFQISLKYKI